MKSKSARHVLVVGTTNRGKIEEIKRLLSQVPVDVRTPDMFEPMPDVVEDAETLEGNARLKAQAWFDRTGMPSVADDTGLEVDALDGKPGVRSARFAGPASVDVDNRRELLRQLNGVADRSARFRSVIAYVDELGPVYFEGVCEGDILTEERGTKGFGYDALFVPKGLDKTFAELETDEKNLLSHRGTALRKFCAFLHDQVQSTPGDPRS